MMQVADCAPVLFVDPVHHLLAVLHAGWRGACAGIVSQALQQMMHNAGTDPASVVISVGPTLCPRCMEVGEEVASAVEHAFGSAAILRTAANPHLVLREIFLRDAARVGVSREQIVFHPDCTRCCNDLFFSHRGQAGHAGRFALVAWWEE